jgi:hypothetical protein
VRYLLSAKSGPKLLSFVHILKYNIALNYDENSPNPVTLRARGKFKNQVPGCTRQLLPQAYSSGEVTRSLSRPSGKMSCTYEQGPMLLFKKYFRQKIVKTMAK